MITVAQLIAILQTMPQDVPVTGYNGQECTDWVSIEGIRLHHTDDHVSEILYDDREPGYIRYNGPYVDIMGL